MDRPQMAESGPSPILMLLALKWKWVMPGHWIKGGDFENIYIYIYIYKSYLFKR